MSAQYITCPRTLEVHPPAQMAELSLRTFEVWRLPELRRTRHGYREVEWLAESNATAHGISELSSPLSD